MFQDIGKCLEVGASLTFAGLLNKSSHQLSCRWFGVKNLKSFGQHRLIGDRTSRTGRAAFISCSGDIFHTDLGIPK